MAFPNNLAEKKQAAIVWLANAVASEAPETVNHSRRLAICRLLLNGGGGVQSYMDIDFAAQGYNDATALNDIQNRLSGLLTNMVALGF